MEWRNSLLSYVQIKGTGKFSLSTHIYRRAEAQLYTFITLALYRDKFLSHNVTDVTLTALTQFTDKL